jgi:hypothetical protein
MQMLGIGERKAGLRTHCPKCRTELIVPGPAAPPALAPPPPIVAGSVEVPLPLPPLRPARSPAHELYLALAAILLLGGIYAYLARNGAPRPGGRLGHWLGGVGFLLMLSTETLYSLRKRLRSFALGRMSLWLQIHIFTGLVGPFLVLLHTAGRFHGLAGVLTLLTGVMVLSGLVGRYIYTAVPRTLDGVEAGVKDLEVRLAEADARMQALGIDLGDSAALASEPPRESWVLVLGRGFLCWRQRRRVHRALRHLSRADRARTAEFERLLAQRYRLQLQLQSLAGARRLLALWHVFHIPLGAVLFTLAGVHIVAALYYATFLR